MTDEATGVDSLAVPSKTFELSPTFVHYDNLAWQLPSWGTAIAAGVVLTAYEVKEKLEATDRIGPEVAASLILLMGAVLLLSLSMALYKYRIFQSASIATPIRNPPYGVEPSAGVVLQGVIYAVTGIVFGLSLVEYFGYLWLVPASLDAFLWIWFRTEMKYQDHVGAIQDAWGIVSVRYKQDRWVKVAWSKRFARIPFFWATMMLGFLFGIAYARNSL